MAPIAGKPAPLTVEWLNRTILSANFGPFEAQLSADHIGDRPVTYLNELSATSTFQIGPAASYAFALPRAPWAKSARVTLQAAF